MILRYALILLSSLSFLGYGISYFKSTEMKLEFKRFGLEKFGAPTATLEVLGGIGLTLFVKFPPVDLKHGPVDLKKPFAAPITFKEIAPWLLAIILLAAILFLVIYAINRRNKNRPLFQRPAKPKTPPHLTAIQELDKLKEEQLWQQEKFKDYYTRLTDIVRVYIEDRFKMAAMEQTTHEIIAGFKESKESIENKSLLELKEILELADLVKFAKLTPLPDENFKMLSNAYLFVKETTIETVAEPVEAIKEEVIEPENIDVKDKKGDTQL